MKTNILVVYDSHFGNTEKVAKAIGKIFTKKFKCKTTHIGKISPEELSNFDLIIAGSPTQRFSATDAIKEFLTTVPEYSLKNAKFAVFDTRFGKDKIKGNIFLNILVPIFGYGVEPMSKILTSKGGTEIINPNGFIVNGIEGPLYEGELERAEKWAKEIAGKL